MQRVVSINLNGNAYQLEENGYNALFAYLDAMESQLKDDPERAQKLADLERVAAEKCQACLGPHKTVVTSSEIERIITELGPAPRQPAEEPKSSSSGSAGSSNSTGSTFGSTWHPHRRLYQIREGSMISGVCAGLADYLHIDVTIIRIMFVVFALASSGFGVIAYGVLMFVLPKVETRAGAATGSPSAGTHGWPWDDGWPWDKHGWPWDHPAPAAPAPPPAPSSQPSQQSTAGQPNPPTTWAPQTRAEWRDARRAARMHYGWSPFGTIGMVFCLMFAFFWLSFWTRGHFFFGWPYFWGFPHWIGIVFFFMMMRFIFMPFRAARWQRYGYGPYGPYGGPYAHPQHAWVSMWNGLAWFAAMIFIVWAAYHYIPEVHDFIRDIQTNWSGNNFNI